MLHQVNDGAPYPHTVVVPHVFEAVDLEGGGALVRPKGTSVPNVIATNVGWLVPHAPQKLWKGFGLGLFAVHIQIRK